MPGLTQVQIIAMKKKKSISILAHIFIWLFLSLGYSFLSEPIVAYMFPGIHNVEIWLTVLLIGLILIFIGTGISLIVRFRIKRKEENL